MGRTKQTARPPFTAYPEPIQSEWPAPTATLPTAAPVSGNYLTWTAADPGYHTVANTGRLAWTPGIAAIGQHQVEIVVSNGVLGRIQS